MAISDHSEVPERKPAGEFFSDPGARIVWAAVRDLDEGLKHELLDLLASELAAPTARRTPSEVRAARAVSALREADRINRDRGRPLLRQEDYRSLRGELGEREGWPPDGSVRRWLGGSWNDALRSARLATLPDGDATVNELGPAFTREECVNAVREYMADTGDPLPSLHAVINWARRRDVRARPGHRPRSQGPYDRLFGSFNELLEAAGVVADRAAGQGTDGSGGYGFVRPPHGYGYTPEQVRAALRTVAGRLGRSPKQVEYQRERQTIFDEAKAAGRPPRAMPSFVLIQQRYRHWDSALIDAGLAPNNTRQNRRVVDRAPSGRPYPEDELIRWLRESYAELGEPFTTSAYHNWRIEKIEAESTPIRLVRIPDHPAFYRRFGNWANACARAGLGREHSDPNQTEHGQADAGALPEPRARRDRGETDG